MCSKCAFAFNHYGMLSFFLQHLSPCSTRCSSKCSHTKSLWCPLLHPLLLHTCKALAIPGINRWNILGAAVSDLVFIAVQQPLSSWRALWTQQLWTLVIKLPVWLISTLASIGPAGPLARLNYSHSDIHSTDCSRPKLLWAHFKKLKKKKKDLLTSRRCRNEADIASKLLSLFDVPDSARTKKKIKHF